MSELQDLREVVGSVVGNGPIWHPFQKTQHWHCSRILGASTLCTLTGVCRGTHLSGSLERKHKKLHVKFTPRRHCGPTHTGCSVRHLVFGVKQLCPLPFVAFVLYHKSPLTNRTSPFTCALNLCFTAPLSFKGTLFCIFNTFSMMMFVNTLASKMSAYQTM